MESLGRVSSLQVFLDQVIKRSLFAWLESKSVSKVLFHIWRLNYSLGMQNYSRLVPPNLPSSWQTDIEPDISLCPQDPRDIAARESQLSKSKSASGQPYSSLSTAIPIIPQRLSQESARNVQSAQPGARFTSATPPESYQCSMQPQDPRREWKAKLEKSNSTQNQLVSQNPSMSVPTGAGVPQKRKYDQVQSFSEAQTGQHRQDKHDGAISRDPVVIDLVKDTYPPHDKKQEAEAKSSQPQVEHNLIRGNWMSPDGFQGQMKGLTGRIGNFKMDAGSIAGPLPPIMGHMVAAPHQFGGSALSVQNALQQSMQPGNGLQMQLGRGLTGVGQVLPTQQRPVGVQLYRQDGKPMQSAPAQGNLQPRLIIILFVRYRD